jgi:Tfp pilus assembly major pilin PilA
VRAPLFECSAHRLTAPHCRKKAKKARAKAKKRQAHGTLPVEGAPAESPGASAAAVDACGVMLSATLALRGAQGA